MAETSPLPCVSSCPWTTSGSIRLRDSREFFANTFLSPSNDNVIQSFLRDSIDAAVSLNSCDRWTNGRCLPQARTRSRIQRRNTLPVRFSSEFQAGELESSLGEENVQPPSTVPSSSSFASLSCEKQSDNHRHRYDSSSFSPLSPATTTIAATEVQVGGSLPSVLENPPPSPRDENDDPCPSATSTVMAGGVNGSIATTTNPRRTRSDISREPLRESLLRSCDSSSVIMYAGGEGDNDRDRDNRMEGEARIIGRLLELESETMRQQQENERLEREMRALQERVKEAEEEMETREKENQRLMFEEAKRASFVLELQVQVASITARAMESAKEVEEKNLQVKEMERELGDLRASIESLKQQQAMEVEKLKAELKEMTAKHEEEVAKLREQGIDVSLGAGGRVVGFLSPPPPPPPLHRRSASTASSWNHEVLEEEKKVREWAWEMESRFAIPSSAHSWEKQTQPQPQPQPQQQQHMPSKVATTMTTTRTTPTAMMTEFLQEGEMMMSYLPGENSEFDCGDFYAVEKDEDEKIRAWAWELESRSLSQRQDGGSSCSSSWIRMLSEDREMLTATVKDLRRALSLAKEELAAIHLEMAKAYDTIDEKAVRIGELTSEVVRLQSDIRCKVSEEKSRRGAVEEVSEEGNGKTTAMVVKTSAAQETERGEEAVAVLATDVREGEEGQLAACHVDAEEDREGKKTTAMAVAPLEEEGRASLRGEDSGDGEEKDDEALGSFTGCGYGVEDMEKELGRMREMVTEMKKRVAAAEEAVEREREVRMQGEAAGVATTLQLESESEKLCEAEDVLNYQMMEIERLLREVDMLEAKVSEVIRVGEESEEEWRQIVEALMREKAQMEANLVAALEVARSAEEKSRVLEKDRMDATMAMGWLFNRMGGELLRVVDGVVETGGAHMFAGVDVWKKMKTKLEGLRKLIVALTNTTPSAPAPKDGGKGSGGASKLQSLSAADAQNLAKAVEQFANVAMPAMLLIGVEIIQQACPSKAVRPQANVARRASDVRCASARAPTRKGYTCLIPARREKHAGQRGRERRRRGEEEKQQRRRDDTKVETTCRRDDEGIEKPREEEEQKRRSRGAEEEKKRRRRRGGEEEEEQRSSRGGEEEKKSRGEEEERREKQEERRRELERR
ncbi:hypothetical protein CBR_g1122 [Chara braunii]|uniref:Uncharacterized protein n=1 Tax=Chara braunii TaxID=69332 RepID=A0A388KD69_CHABU|nr:hypothetical protein CBR_g1122 [Chara braunii]|eukprot:GBG68002.1 hypothetical protein CBR_g1122 [Chara braunii]